MAIYRQDIAGVKDAIYCTNPPFGEVVVKDLTDGQIIEYIFAQGFSPINSCIFYYNKGNFERMLALVKQGKLVWRNCEGAAVELP